MDSMDSMKESKIRVKFLVVDSSWNPPTILSIPSIPSIPTLPTTPASAAPAFLACAQAGPRSGSPVEEAAADRCYQRKKIRADTRQLRALITLESAVAIYSGWTETSGIEWKIALVGIRA
jgi:hypothetical protein